MSGIIGRSENMNSGIIGKPPVGSIIQIRGKRHLNLITIPASYVEIISVAMYNVRADSQCVINYSLNVRMNDDSRGYQMNIFSDDGTTRRCVANGNSSTAAFNDHTVFPGAANNSAPFGGGTVHQFCYWGDFESTVANAAFGEVYQPMAGVCLDESPPSGDITYRLVANYFSDSCNLAHNGQQCMTVMEISSDGSTSQ